jgi:VWFA-related protein
MHCARTVIVLVAAVFLASSTVRAQSVERSVFVSVLNQSSEPVPGLGADAFTVREDGTQREVLRVSKATGPIHLAILIDNSQAATDYISDFRGALETFVTERASKGHDVAVIALADRPTVLADYTSSAEQLARATQRIFAQEGSGTLLLDGLVDVSRGLQKREAERRVILAITTEGTDFSNIGHERTIDALVESGAQFFALVVTRGGGAAMTSEEDNQYNLVYGRPDTTVPPKRVEVTVRDPGLKARAVVAATRRRAGAGK